MAAGENTEKRSGRWMESEGGGCNPGIGVGELNKNNTK
jgi:hypothetical protein